MSNSKLRNNLMGNMLAPRLAGLDANPKAKLVPLERIVSNPFQVRQDFDSPEAAAALQELAEDIAQRGILQPLVVRPVASGSDSSLENFEIVAGERRYRAARLVGLTQLPVIVENYSNEEARLVSLTENLQRRDLSFVEEVAFLAELDKQRAAIGEGGDSDLARLIHKSRSYVAKRLKLAAAPALLAKVAKGELSLNEAYSQAVGSKKLEVAPDPLVIEVAKVDPASSATTEAETGEAVSNPAIPTAAPSQSQVVARLRPSLFATRVVPFTRLREAVASLSREVETLAEDERVSLKQEVAQLEQALALLRAKL